ncbi:transcriptional regulator [Kitasatospora sp. NPDC094011]|uniref:transcriptional regulator n=1 Tax=Kitasatospora sp. NPDC094011 TaxID=3364090 RepID=UPI00381536F0
MSTPTPHPASRAATFAAAYALLRASADLADHWIQTDHQAGTKGDRSAVGRRACAAHVATYTTTQAAALLLGTRLLGLRPKLRRVLTALAVSAATHYLADRRVPLLRAAEATRRGNFARLADHGMNGAYILDQSWHHIVETCAALIVAG